MTIRNIRIALFTLGCGVGAVGVVAALLRLNVWWPGSVGALLVLAVVDAVLVWKGRKP